MSYINHLRAIFFLPFMVTIVIPSVLVFFGGVNFAWAMPAPLNWLIAAASIAFVACGLLLLVKTIALFVREGQGTLAPWDPTRKLVVRGVYRHVRNPMISGVICILLGEALLFGSTGVLTWLILFVLANVIYIPFVEEVSLEARFGADYVRYQQNVPRWIPRLRAWEPASDEVRSQ